MSVCTSMSVCVCVCVCVCVWHREEETMLSQVYKARMEYLVCGMLSASEYVIFFNPVDMWPRASGKIKRSNCNGINKVETNLKFQTSIKSWVEYACVYHLWSLGLTLLHGSKCPWSGFCFSIGDSHHRIKSLLFLVQSQS